MFLPGSRDSFKKALRRSRIKTRDSHSKRGLWTMSRTDSGNEKRTSKPNAWVSFLLFVDFSGEGRGLVQGAVSVRCQTERGLSP